MRVYSRLGRFSSGWLNYIFRERSKGGWREGDHSCDCILRHREQEKLFFIIVMIMRNDIVSYKFGKKHKKKMNTCAPNISAVTLHCLTGVDTNQSEANPIDIFGAVR